MGIDDLVDDVATAIRNAADDVRIAVRDLALSDDVRGLVLGLKIDKMSWMQNMDVQALPAQAVADRERLSEIRLDGDAVQPMFCPGGDQHCALDINRIVGVSKTVPARIRRRMEKALEAYCNEMDEIAREVSECGVDVTVRYHLTPTGPELALGYAHEMKEDSATQSAVN